MILNTLITFCQRSRSLFCVFGGLTCQKKKKFNKQHSFTFSRTIFEEQIRFWRLLKLNQSKKLRTYLHFLLCIIDQCVVIHTGLHLKTCEHILLDVALFQAVCLEQQESSPSLAPHCQVPSLWSTTQPSEPSTLPEQAGLSLEAWVPWACQLLWLPTLS